MKKVETVDAYIASMPKEHQDRLNQLRALIQNVAPNAVERISYAIPYYHYKGRLVYFALWKDHIGLYAITAPLLKQFKTELSGYVLSKGTIHLPHREKLPVTLIRKLVKAQMKLNEDAEEKKSR